MQKKTLNHNKSHSECMTLMTSLHKDAPATVLQDWGLTAYYGPGRAGRFGHCPPPLYHPASQPWCKLDTRLKLNFLVEMWSNWIHGLCALCNMVYDTWSNWTHFELKHWFFWNTAELKHGRIETFSFDILWCCNLTGWYISLHETENGVVGIKVNQNTPPELK